jgi:hypothetical protein
MVSGIRYQHIVNRYLRGKRSLARLLAVLVLLLLLIVWHQYTLALGMLIYAMLGPVTWAYLKWRPATGDDALDLARVDIRPYLSCRPRKSRCQLSAGPLVTNSSQPQGRPTGRGLDDPQVVRRPKHGQ